MTEKEILKSKLTLFLKKYGVYDAYIVGLAEQGHNGKTIDEIVEWGVRYRAKKSIIDHSFYWDFVPLTDDQPSWSYLNNKFKENYDTLPYEGLEPDQWTNMWEE